MVKKDKGFWYQLTKWDTAEGLKPIMTHLSGQRAYKGIYYIVKDRRTTKGDRQAIFTKGENIPTNNYERYMYEPFKAKKGNDDSRVMVDGKYLLYKATRDHRLTGGEIRRKEHTQKVAFKFTGI